ncbi:hypothetical protein [Desulfatitalea alkaliphila]|uniref:Uncharacterized protein n=1 Tax=Desulfatitalea alkaliphila TaxID=2929485 RepID=A0AA41UHX8_9BACT|nr:hypothetical protein [Desulfatitalea alkaliphila]MCJ8500130.1 hypothetical protein [Desulfatitalea alkaliphila]
MEFKEEAKIEQFRSVIAVGASALKGALLINGGGVIAVLTFIGNQKDQQGFTWFVSAMFVMCCGIALAVFAKVLAYITQIKVTSQKFLVENGFTKCSNNNNDRLHLFTGFATKTY